MPGGVCRRAGRLGTGRCKQAHKARSIRLPQFPGACTCKRRVFLGGQGCPGRVDSARYVGSGRPPTRPTSTQNARACAGWPTQLRAFHGERPDPRCAPTIFHPGFSLPDNCRQRPPWNQNAAGRWVMGQSAPGRVGLNSAGHGACSCAAILAQLRPFRHALEM